MKLDVESMREALFRHPEAWFLDTFWKDFPNSMFREVDTIYLRFPDKEAFILGYGDVITCRDQPASELFPEMMSVVKDVMKNSGCKTLGRVLINRLMPGTRVFPHSDGKNLPYHRYHVVIETNGDVEFTCGDECVLMKQGEVWWFDNSSLHEVVNRGTTPRIHLIADMK